MTPHTDAFRAELRAHLLPRNAGANLARELGCLPVEVSRWKRGARKPGHAATLAILAKMQPDSVARVLAKDARP